MAEKEDPLKKFEAVPYAKVPDPEVAKWRTVTYEALTHPDEAPERVSLRLYGHRAEVYQAALLHLQKVTWNETEYTTVAAFVDFANGPGDTEYMEAIRYSIESIRIADNCPCCHR